MAARQPGEDTPDPRRPVSRIPGKAGSLQQKLFEGDSDGAEANGVYGWNAPGLAAPSADLADPFSSVVTPAKSQTLLDGPVLESSASTDDDAPDVLNLSNESTPLPYDPTGTVIISGREGHAHFINGEYAGGKISHDGKPVFIHTSSIPAGFGDASGKHLNLYYHADNDAWAISTDLGSLDVLAYVLGDVLDPSSPSISFEEIHWSVSDGAGDYELDPKVRMSGTAVPLHQPDQLVNEATTSPVRFQSVGDDDDDLADDLSLSSVLDSAPQLHEDDVLPQPEGRMRRSQSAPLPVLVSEQDDTEPDTASADNAGAEATPTKRSPPKGMPQSKDDMSLPSTPSADRSPQPRARSKSFRDRAASTLKHGAKTLRKLPKSTYKGTRNRLRNLAAGDTMTDTIKRLLSKFSSATTGEDRAQIAENVLKLLRRPLDERDTAEDMAKVCLQVWEEFLQRVDSQELRFREWYFDTIIAVMVRDELQCFSAAPKERPAWLKQRCHLQVKTHMYVVEKMNVGSMYETLMLFCAKALAINYFCIPGLAAIIVNAIVRATPISGRRGRKIGDNVATRAVAAQQSLRKLVPKDKKSVFHCLHQVCKVNCTPDKDQCAITKPKTSNPPPFSTVVTPAATIDMLESWRIGAHPLDSKDLWPMDMEGGPWTTRFVSNTEAGFSFLSVFLEVLFRRCRSIFQFSFFRNKVEQRLGLKQRSVIGVVFMPGFVELTSCLLRLALTSGLALKRTFHIGSGPPSVICNWTDRTAACVLSLCQDGVVATCLMQDLMEQTSTSHVADVMALLGSFKAFLESYERMHQSSLPESLDATLMATFIRRLLKCEHYVVLMFSLRWVYDCVDHFPAEHRSHVMSTLTDPESLELIFCHWEPSVRHIAHMLVLYRLVDKVAPRQQFSMIKQFQTLLSDPSVPDALDLSQFELVVKDPALIQNYRTQFGNVRTFLKDIALAHNPASPPYRPENFSAGGPCNVHPPEKRCTCTRPKRQRRYASCSLEEFRSSLDSAITWVKEHRLSSTSDAKQSTFPSMVLSLPPLQNMTSLYSQKSNKPMM